MDDATPRQTLHERPVGASVAEPGEAPESNADRFVADARRLDGNRWLLAVVCDGVSSSPMVRARRRWPRRTGRRRSRTGRGTGPRRSPGCFESGKGAR